MPGILLRTRDVREAVNRQSRPLETESVVQEADRLERNLRKREAAERHHVTKVRPLKPNRTRQKKFTLKTHLRDPWNTIQRQICEQTERMPTRDYVLWGLK